MQALNQGEPWKMGESIGVTQAHALARGEELQNVYRWCDEFFEQHPETAVLSD
ncbi:hypothetical protein [Hymenobacter sp. UYCo722]|uniref:hypothetical protein n=1 Tax=Hymenobacter sp. UYCo722 TaxID=3156335 RepID=UPI003397486A